MIENIIFYDLIAEIKRLFQKMRNGEHKYVSENNHLIKLNIYKDEE